MCGYRGHSKSLSALAMMQIARAAASEHRPCQACTETPPRRRSRGVRAPAGPTCAPSACSAWWPLARRTARLLSEDSLKSPRTWATQARPLAVLGLIALVLLVGHRWLAAALAACGRLAIVRVAMVACALGVILCIAAFLGSFNWVIYSTRYPLVPILLAVGVTLVGYGLYIRRLAQPDPPHRGWPDRIQVIVLIVLDVALIFWVVAVYASVSGQQVGQHLASNLQAQPAVVVYTVASGIRCKR